MEVSSGVLLYRNNNGVIEFFVCTPDGPYWKYRELWCFPKGHMENNETEIETALREVKEEVGVNVTLIEGFKVNDEYILTKKENTLKQVVYFLGVYSNQEYTYQKEELSNAFLVSYEEAIDLFQFENLRRILKSANDYLMKIVK